MKGLLIILFCYMSSLMFGQNDWLIGKWVCKGTLHGFKEFPSTNDSFEKGACDLTWNFKKNGQAIRKAGDSKTEFKWKLNVTNDTLFIYTDNIHYTYRYPLHKYKDNEIAIYRTRDEVRTAYLLSKK